MEISENMKKEVLEKAKAYVESEKNSSFRSEVENAIKAEAWDDLFDRF